MQVAERVKDAIVDTADGRNITEWTKQEGCWARLRSMEFRFDPFTSETSSLTPTADWPAPNAYVWKPQLGGRDTSGTGNSHRGSLPALPPPQVEAPWGHRVLGAGAHTLHVYAAPMPGSDGPDYIFNVVVDLEGQTITAVDELESAAHAQVLAWLTESGFPS